MYEIFDKTKLGKWHINLWSLGILHDIVLKVYFLLLYLYTIYKNRTRSFCHQIFKFRKKTTWSTHIKGKIDNISMHSKWNIFET